MLYFNLQALSQTRFLYQARIEEFIDRRNSPVMSTLLNEVARCCLIKFFDSGMWSVRPSPSPLQRQHKMFFSACVIFVFRISNMTENRNPSNRSEWFWNSPGKRRTSMRFTTMGSHSTRTPKVRSINLRAAARFFLAALADEDGTRQI